MKALLVLRRKLLATFRVTLLRLQFRDIQVGKKFFCNKGFFLSRTIKLRVGDNVYFGRYTHVGNNLTIGDHVMVASHTAFVGGDHRIDNIGATLIRNSGRKSSKTTIIEDNVWLGHGCIIMAGITIKSGAVVAAGSVVTKDVGNDEIVGGSPAQLIRKRKP